MSDHPLAPLPLNICPDSVCCVFIVSAVRVPVGATVNYFGTVIPVFKLALVGLRGCVQSWSGCVCWGAATSHCVNTNTHPVLLLPVSVRMIS